MAAGNPSWSDLVTFTLEHRLKTLADAVTNHNALWRYLKTKGGVRTAPGGTSIVEPIEFRDNPTFGWFEGYELLDITPASVHTASVHAWKNAHVSVSISGTEMAKNSGPDAQRDLLRSKISNAEHSMVNGLSTAAYGTGSDGKSIQGLQHLVAENPTTGTVGGIDRSDSANAWWRNYYLDVTTDWADSTKIQAQMFAACLALVRGTDGPGLIITDGAAYTAYNKSLVAIQQITQATKGESGFSELAFRYPGGTADVVYDPTNANEQMFFINLDTIKLRPHKDRNMQVSAKRQSINQDAEVTHIFWMGNMTANNLALNGVVFS